ncbi:wHTH domain-containing protein [Streptomyces fumanus]|uniref:wHTH domain-containing protein n=1 Tax=Streptomyces fumanus TaxID=67302 RepID=UPI0033F97899
MTEPLDYWTALDRLVKLAGEPQAAAVCAVMRQDAPREARVPSDNTVADWVRMRTVPRDDRLLELFLRALEQLARRRNAALPPVPWPRWQKLAQRAREERRAGAARSVPRTPPGGPDWGREVADAAVWGLVRSEAEALREQARGFAGRLAASYEETSRALAGDPWHDRHLARRISRRTNQLVHLLWRERDGFLEPAEAALVALLPFLHQAHRTRTAADLCHVDPTDLGPRSGPDEFRRMYEVLLRAHERLTRRAEMGVLKDREDGRPGIGWWLFHQWVKRQPGRIADVLAPLEAPEAQLDDLRVVLDPDLLSRLLSCAHAGPHELFDPARADHLRQDAFVLDFHGRDFPEVRERLVGPLFTVAHRMAVEAADLSSVLVRHVGIPDALDLGGFLATVDRASWQSARDGLGLKAACSHPAAVAALAEHARNLEPLLRTVRHTGAADFGGLPLYTRTDDVREVDESGRPVAIGGVIRFRIDEERVQELLMGENLYRDRSLAIRELYQNALDACRYRRARAEAADPFSSYRGRIEFVQGWDEEEGRHYLECRDNGVGMDELTLSEVFSQAGIRFTDLPRYQEERQEWQSRGVTMHPNSRFGIGVLSYFMLADEVRVTTCHMDAVNGRLREITVLITGPGHYFRVRRTDRPGTIGTTVRLYLRGGDKAPSCVRELRRLLGVSEFSTSAVHGTHTATWDAGEPRPREALGIRPDGYSAHGRLVTWAERPGGPDGQVVWCRHGGGLLVDGIHCEPRVRKGVLSRLGETGALRGAIVNLTGATRPRRLSVDRTEILDADVCADAERLLVAALPALLAADPPLLDHAWLTEVAEHSPRLADLVTEAAGAAGYELEVGGVTRSMAVTGFFPSDGGILSSRDLRDGRSRIWRSSMYVAADNAIRLWRLLAHRPHPMLSALTELVPELDQVERVLPALPSDASMHTPKVADAGERPWPSDVRTPAFAAFVAETRGITYRATLARMTALRLRTPALPDGDPVIDEINTALLSDDLLGIDFTHRRHHALDADRPVPPGHLLKARFAFGISLGEATERLRTFGFTVPDLDPSTEDADEHLLRLLSARLDGQSPWLAVDAPVPPDHLVEVHRQLALDIRAAAATLRTFGHTVVGEDQVAENPEETLVLVRWKPGYPTPYHAASDTPASHVLGRALALGRPAREVARDLRALGFTLRITAAQEGLPAEVLREYAPHGWTPELWGQLDAHRAAPPGLLLHTASRQGGTAQQVVARLTALGFTAPPLPSPQETTDLVLLSEKLDGTAPWREAGTAVSVAEIAAMALRTGLAPAAVATRLRLYGLVLPEGPLPPSARDSDQEILGAPPHHHHLTAGKPVPISLVLRAADRLAVPPREVADRLAAYGLATAPVTWPEEPADLLSAVAGSEMPSLDDGGPVPLYEILATSKRHGLPAEEIAELVSGLGLPIKGDDVGHVDTTDIELCGIDSRSATREAPLVALADPLPNFASLFALELPTDGLVDRLRRLGVDLGPLRRTVLEALPDVPGLVMRPGTEIPVT